MRKLKHIAGNRAMEVFGIFCKLLEIAGDSGKSTRGQLLNEDGKAADAQDLAFILDVPEEQISNAITVLLNPKLAWLIQTHSTDTKDNTIHTYTQGAGKVRENPDGPVHSRAPEDSEPTYFHERDIPPQPTDRPDDDELAEILEAWAEKLNRSMAAVPSKDRQTWSDHLAVHDKQWCLDAIAQANSPHAGVVAINHQDRLKALAHPMAEQDTEAMAELRRLDDARRKAADA